MRRAFAISLLLLVLTAASSRAATLNLTTDRPDGIYRSGEAVRFLATLREGDKPVVGREIQYTITGDAGIAVMTGTVTSGEQPAPIILASSKPEFFRCEVSVKTDETTQPTTASVGAGVEPEKITPAQPPPDDFDAFWSAQRRLIADHPATPTLTPVKSGDDAIEAFDVQIPDGPPGTNVSGYFARPRGAKPRSLPAILYPHSAGVRDSDLPHAVRGAKLVSGGMLALDLNAHGVPNGRPPEFYTDLLNGALADHRVRGMQDRERVYFRQMYLRVLRALDFLTQQPEWDGQILIVEGSSQGGGQALVAAGLDHRVTLCLASVPALGDLTAAVVGRESGWPKMLRRAADGSIDQRAVEALRYVDVAHHASRIRCRTMVSVGFVDRTCPPASVYAAYNSIPATTQKSLVARPAMGHAFPKDLIAAWDEVIRVHVRDAQDVRKAARRG